jgi:hypothetical protein
MVEEVMRALKASAKLSRPPLSEVS